MEDSESADQFEDPFRLQEQPELVFGVVAPIGIDLDQLIKILHEELQRVGYQSTVIRLSELLTEVSGLESELSSKPEHKRIESHMRAGTELRTRTKVGGILARLAVAAIQREREKLTGSDRTPDKHRAYILRSLKHRDEVSDLRDVYGDGFVTISAYSPKSDRQRALTKLLAKSEPNKDVSHHNLDAAKLIDIDESEEGKELGQNVEGAFPLADFFVNASERKNLRENLRRSIEIFFGNNFQTPSRDEFGMYQAAAAARRSSDLSRQVGASLVTREGDIISVGCNDIPKAGGGLYWAGDQPDGRDFELLGNDPSEQAKRAIVAEILEQLQKAKLLKNPSQSQDFGAIADKLLHGELRGSQITSLLEFGRVLHAEMNAITDAARNGVMTRGATLYCTTFPCHMCARLIIASGVKRVVFIEPYPKSKTKELYYDSVVIDELTESDDKVNFQSFVGVAPRRYDSFFRIDRRRKKPGGDAVQWEPANAQPRVRRFQASYITIETRTAGAIPNWLQPAELSWNSG